MRAYVTPLTEFYIVDDLKVKVYRRYGDRALVVPSWLTDHVSVLSQQTTSARLPSTPGFVRHSPPARDLPRAQEGARAEEILQQWPAGVVILNRDYDIQMINGAARRIFQIHTNAIGQDFVHLARDFSSAALRTIISEALDGDAVSGVLLRRDVPALAQDETILEVSCFKTQAESDESVMVAISVIDVTAREKLKRDHQRAEAAISKISTQYEDLLNANLDLANAFAKLQVDNEDLLVSSEELQAVTEEVETLNEEMQASNEEVETLNEELQATVEELNTTNDDLQARSSELQELAIQSEDARTQLETILSSMSDAVMAVGTEGEVIWSNGAYESMFGGPGAQFSAQDEFGRTVENAQTPRSRAARRENFSSSFTVTQPDGSLRWYEALGRSALVAGLPVGVVTIRDITERRLRSLQEQWIAHASHELRTPLAALSAFVQLALRLSASGGDGEILSRRLEQALSQARRMSALVQNMIDATRYQYTQVDYTFDFVDLASIVRDAVRTAGVLAGDLTFDVQADDAELTVWADSLRIEQALLNVLTNAIANSPHPGSVVVSILREEYFAIIEIMDHGLGIPLDGLGKIFERFYQGAGVSTGLRLGLYISREIIGWHGGTIEVKTSGADGTTMEIRLPLADADSVSSVEANDSQE